MTYTTAYDHWIRTYWEQWLPEEYGWLWGKAQLIAESSLDPNARSPAGALGLAQFMTKDPNTWSDVCEALNFPSFASPLDPQYAIHGFAWYMHECWKVWTAPRTPLDRLHLAQACYNAGTGNVLAAQRRARADGKPLANAYDDIAPYLPSETYAYVVRIGAIYLSLSDLGVPSAPSA